jgi:septal ring factor EnvC (AmiA/AmiB activator)
VWRASALALVGVLAVAASPARGDDATPPDPRTGIVQQLVDEADSIERSLTAVADKLAGVDTARTRRLSAAYRVLQAPTGADRMATARRRAAARLLVERDLLERRLLADEAGQLRAAATRTTADAARIPTLALPTEIGRPARGAIVRRFGTFEHERSRAKLSRRGLDLEVEARTAVLAAADGVVRYAGPIRGLDAGVIVDHGTYLTVIAKLGELVVPVGAHVKRGDRVGRAARQRVYLEVRVKIGPSGLPIDPEPLLPR